MSRYMFEHLDKHAEHIPEVNPSSLFFVVLVVFSAILAFRSTNLTDRKLTSCKFTGVILQAVIITVETYNEMDN